MTLNTIGEKLVEKLIMRVKCELNEVLPKGARAPSISAAHVIRKFYLFPSLLNLRLNSPLLLVFCRRRKHSQRPV